VSHAARKDGQFSQSIWIFVEKKEETTREMSTVDQHQPQQKTEAAKMSKKRHGDDNRMEVLCWIKQCSKFENFMIEEYCIFYERNSLKVVSFFDLFLLYFIIFIFIIDLFLLL